MAAIGPAGVGCTARFMGDDAVNINGKYYDVSASHGNQLRIASFDDPGIQVGDPVEFLPFSRSAATGSPTAAWMLS